MKSGGDAALEALLARAAEADREAFLEIYDLWAPRLLGVIRRALPGADESEQVLEDLFVRLWRESPRLVASGASVAAWLMLTARAAAVERLRGGPTPKAPATQPAPPALAESTDWLPSPEAVALIEERRLLLHKVLGQLPAHQLAALDRVTFAGRSETEVGEDLAEPLARAQAELRAAMRFLRHRRRAVVGSWTVSI